jgi:hypothetical protein
MSAPDLTRRADRDQWGRVLSDFESKAYSHKPIAATQEIRWGDGANLDLVIPALSVVPVATAFTPQLIDIRHRARVWSLSLSLSWLNFAAGIVGDSITATFIVEFGVGSAKVDLFRLITIPAGGPLSVADIIVPDLPAATIVAVARLMITPVAGAARTYSARTTALAAPITR